MRVDNALLAAELRSRHGVTTTVRLGQLGISEQSIRTLVSKGQLERVVLGVFVAAAWPDSLEHRMAVACAATGGVVCFPTAGLAWQLRKTPGTNLTHVTIAEGRRLDPIPGVKVTRTCYLPESDIVRRDDGIAVTSPPRTAFDAAWRLSDDDLESLIEDGLNRGYFIIPTLQKLGRRTRSRGRPGSKRFREVLDRRDPTKRPVGSDYELRLERALRRRGFPRLQRQCRVELADGRVIHPDLGIPERGFYIEVDHLTWHGGRLADDYDCRRDLQIEALGHHVERVTDVAIDRHLDETVEALWTIWQRLRTRSAESQR
jgi:hypothetical protein